MDEVFIGKPTKNSLIAVSQKLIAASPDGHVLFLNDMNKYHRFFRFNIKLIKLIFTPKGQSLYCIDKEYKVFHLPTTPKKLATNPEFELLITLPSQSKFVHIIPFEKVLYAIQDSFIYVIKQNEIVSTSQFQYPISAVSPISKDFAISMKLIDSSNPVPFVVLAGDQTGRVSRIKFPNDLSFIQKLSDPFIAHSDPISLIVQQDKNIMICGEHGTFYSNSGVEGVLPPPVMSMFIADEAGCLLFSSENRLFVSSLMNPSAFQAVPTFPARISCSTEGFAITDAGFIVSLSSQSPTNLNPQAQYIEYALDKLYDISTQSNFLNQEITKSESKLGGYQLIRAIKSGMKILDSSLKVIPSISPDGIVTITLEVKIDPKNGYSCKGSSLSLQLKYLTGICGNNEINGNKAENEENLGGQRNEIISLPFVETDSIHWSRELKIVSPSPLFVELMMFHETEVVTISSSLFDILDFSVEIGLNSVDIGKLSPIHSIVHQAPPVSLQFKILDGIDLSKTSNPLLTNPHAFVVPYGEHWTIRVDSNVCFVTSGTQSTAIAIRAAILRHISLEYLKDGKQKTTENLFNEKFQILQNAGFELSELLEHEPLPTSELSQKVTQLHSLADQWIQSILNFS